MDPVAAQVAGWLQALGVDGAPETERTPERVAELWSQNLLSGYGRDPARVLAERIQDTGGARVELAGIPFHGVCPHHLLPYFGTVDLVYDPAGQVVGLGALEKLVCAYSRRLVLQETLTQQLVEALMDHLGARGAECRIEAQHLCLMLRGREPRSTVVRTRLARGSLE